MATAVPESGSRLRAMGRAFADRNYRLFFAGQGVSLVGTWMTRLASGWLVFRLGGPGAPFFLGGRCVCGLAPPFFGWPVGGAVVGRRCPPCVADRVPRRCLLQSPGPAWLEF